MNDQDTQLDWQAFWLTLANAFMPPKRPEVAAAFRDVLADDLEALGTALDLDLSVELADLRQAIAALSDDEALLVAYSHLFLQPPLPASLNLGLYVDGALNGPCLDVLENAYRKIGIAKREDLHDLPDHAAMQMEVLAVLFGEREPAMTPSDFANLCLVGALPRLANAVVADSPASPWAALSRIAARAIQTFALAPDKETLHRSRRAQGRADTGIGVWRHCARCGKPFAREKEIQIMAKALEQANLPSDFLVNCPDCRDAAQGFFRRPIK
ncbi:molecular chaperone TorD family protein [Sulfuricystis multivorans]|uniref:molecular chaperone TorD family protein n=1 Tax=Sulfuricystis multivorans TaxID=2211108 RepID=UPI000F832ED9|nr:molecular chaperone TorD family protein [Sulfuricystis multivorans]